MTTNGLLQIALFFIVLVLLTKPMGAYMKKVFEGEKHTLSSPLGWLERIIYRVCGINPAQEMRWTTYAFALLAFSVVGMVFSYVALRAQSLLPFNPQGFGTKEMAPDLAFNTAASFTTNTNWQSYVPETTMSYFSQMVSLAIHNWMSAASGAAVAIAVVRGFSRREVNSLGNFWADVVRVTLYVLAPICLVYTLFLVASGVPQNFSPYVKATTLEGVAQTIAMGPVASQEAIKNLGTNGGGFFNANAAHPFENPTPLVNFIQMLSIFLIPAGLTYTFGKMVGNAKQGWAIFAAMSIMFFAGVGVAYKYEAAGTPGLVKAGVQTAATETQSGGNMEGKETRFGIANSALFATVTTDASCGAVNAMHDSFTPLGGLVPLINIMAGEVIFGGVGAGLYGILMFAVIAVFIAGLMVGRTPEYLGKKIEQFEVKMAILAVLVLDASILGFTMLGTNLSLPPGATSQTFTEAQAADEAKLPPLAKWNHVNSSSPSNYYGATYNNVNNSGAHGFSEILYAYTSATGNNGSAFAGITANTPYYNVTLGLAMIIGRFLMIVPLLAMAGKLAQKKFVPASSGTFPTDSGTFVVLLIGTVILVGALTYFPALALGPIVEHFQMNAGKVF